MKLMKDEFDEKSVLFGYTFVNIGTTVQELYHFESDLLSRESYAKVDIVFIVFSIFGYDGRKKSVRLYDKRRNQAQSNCLRDYDHV